MNRLRTLACALSALAAVVVLMVAASTASAVPKPADDPFYKYTGSTPLPAITPGKVLKTRTVLYHAFGIPAPLKTTQMLYRSTDALGQPTTNVTSVIEPGLNSLLGSNKVASYQSAYDSLSINDQPSYVIAGGVSFGGILPNVETALFTPLLLAGYTVVVSDTEGQQADFAAGPEYGYNTLDSIRAALSSNAVNVSNSARVGMIGYSGGAIATEWASELAAGYAPDLTDNLVGSAFGGVLVHPAHNLHYVEGAPIWAGVMPMAIVGIARSYKLDLLPYLSDYGKKVFADMQSLPIASAILGYSGVTWKDLAKPEYATPESVPIYVQTANKLIMSTGGTPTMPLMIGQGANGTLEGTPNDKPGIGPGDGVMIAGDVRALSREYCRRGVKVSYTQYDALSHGTALAIWAPQALLWLADRLNGKSAPQNCASIAPGGSLAPIAVQ